MPLAQGPPQENLTMVGSMPKYSRYSPATPPMSFSPDRYSLLYSFQHLPDKVSFIMLFIPPGLRKSLLNGMPSNCLFYLRTKLISKLRV